MKGWIRKTIMILIAALLLACVSSRHQGRQVHESIMEDQERCVDEWRNVLQEWEDLSSGTSTSMRELRAELKNSKEGEFALLARRSWEAQPDSVSSTWQWPLEESEERKVGLVVEEESSGVVAKGCEDGAIYILPALLGEEVVSQRKTSPLRNLDVSDVDSSRSDPSKIGRWMFYWVFVAAMERE